MNPFSSLIYQSDINDIFPDRKSEDNAVETSTDHLINVSFNINNNLISYSSTKRKESGKKEKKKNIYIYIYI